MADNPRQDLFLKISRNLLEQELTDLRNYVSGAEILPARFVQKADAHQIFIQLEKERKLEPGDLSLLVGLLTKIGRRDYAEKAEKIAQDEAKALREPTKRTRQESSGMDSPVKLTYTKMENDGRQVFLTPEAERILSELPPRPVDVVAVVGPMRKGKSHLGNLLCKRKSGFPLGNELPSETKDFWFWIGPHPVQLDRYIMVIDTEGLGDYADEQQNEKDLEYLVLATLFSNHLVFNLQGNLDHTLLSHLRYGLSPDAYLEVVLERKKGHTKAVRAHNEMTDAVKDFFPRRHLRLIPPPTADRDTLSNLDKVTAGALQREYNDAVNNFIGEVWNSGLVKTVNQVSLKTTGLLDIMRYYVGAINGPRALPSVVGAYDAMVEGECRRAVDENMQQFLETVENTVKPSIPTDEQDCNKRIKAAAEDAVSKLCADVGKWDKSGSWKEHLQAGLEKERLSLLQLNGSKSKTLCEDILGEVDQSVQDNLGKGAYNRIGGFDAYVRDMDVVFNSYRHRAFGKGPAVEAVLETFRIAETTRRHMIKDTEQKLVEDDKRLKEEERKKEEARAAAERAAEAQRRAEAERAAEEEKRLAAEAEAKRLTTEAEIRRTIRDTSYGSSGQVNIAGRNISYDTERRIYNWQQVYKGTARDVTSGVTGKSGNRQSRQGAVEHAIEDVFRQLKAKNII
ncbi:guanylate-binding protein 1-like [Branchiostoma floridae]|uniref:Guanylate-binding protein 1-like n=1 Tax=Branchiostoma floridae TaxID=7739 RepID=A0A9J7LD76_BRAFL|nr:guanylate-binding protein 1-like [Branchiostoma floridae]